MGCILCLLGLDIIPRPDAIGIQCQTGASSAFVVARSYLIFPWFLRFSSPLLRTNLAALRGRRGQGHDVSLRAPSEVIYCGGRMLLPKMRRVLLGGQLGGPTERGRRRAGGGSVLFCDRGARQASPLHPYVINATASLRLQRNGGEARQRELGEGTMGRPQWYLHCTRKRDFHVMS